MTPDHAIIELGNKKVVEAYTRFVDGKRVYVYNGHGVVHCVPSEIVLKRKVEDLDSEVALELLNKL